jgi:2-oxoglutarate-Fe(II)-dependent dioxygenase family protein
MRITNDLEKFLNLTLSLIHPELFHCGLSMLQSLRQLEVTKDVALNWQSVYTGISIICNRRTPPHRDSKGRPQWFDVLLSYSGTGARPRLRINDLGLDLKYSSGTVVGFCGSIFEHEVSSWGVGDRVCYAHFMRESVRKRLDAPLAGWVNRSIYIPGTPSQ